MIRTSAHVDILCKEICGCFLIKKFFPQPKTCEDGIDKKILFYDFEIFAISIS